MKKVFIIVALFVMLAVLLTGCVSDKGYVVSSRGFAPLSVKWNQNTLIPEIDVMGYIANDYIDCPAGGKVEIPQEYEINGIKVNRTIKVDLSNTKPKTTFFEAIDSKVNQPIEEKKQVD